MKKRIVNRVDRHLARRLREARRETGLSTRKVSEMLPRRLALSHTTIASYENGASVPPVNVLAALADIFSRPLNWFLENRESLECFRYRNLASRVRIREQRQFEAVAGKWAEAYFNLDKKLKGHPSHAARRFDLCQISTASELAHEVRTNYLNLDESQPIANIVHVLESFSAWAFELRAGFDVDGAAARHGSAFVVVVNPDIANERLRMNVAHEIGHHLLGQLDDYSDSDHAEVERESYSFAANLLIPPSQLRAAFQRKSFLNLIQYRERFGLSLAVMIYLAEKEKIINTTASRWLWTEMSRRGWRRKEPGYVWRDRAISFETMLEAGVQEKRISWTDAEHITGIREVELRQRVEGILTHEGGQLEDDSGHVRTLKLMDEHDMPQ